MRIVNNTQWVVTALIIDPQLGTISQHGPTIGPGKTAEYKIVTESTGEGDQKTELSHDDSVELAELSRVGVGQDSALGVSLEQPADFALRDAHPLVVRMFARELPKAGTGFSVEVHQGRSVEEVRRDAEEAYGRTIHIQAKIGPRQVRSGSVGYPIVAVDDPFLQVATLAFPRPDHYLLFGYFK